MRTVQVVALVVASTVPLKQVASATLLRDSKVWGRGGEGGQRQLLSTSKKERREQRGHSVASESELLTVSHSSTVASSPLASSAVAVCWPLNQNESDPERAEAAELEVVICPRGKHSLVLQGVGREEGGGDKP